MKKLMFPFFLAAGLAGCSSQTSDNAETEKRIALCQEVIKKYIVEAQTPERDQKRLIGTCHMSQKERTAEQWQCILTSMQKGEKHAEASDKCGSIAAAKPKN